MKKNKQKPLLSRWWRYKYSGPLTFAPIIILSVLGFAYMTSEQEFFSAWSCETINDYVNDVDVPKEITKYSDITEAQVLKISQIQSECRESNPFTPK